jgi:hypothetical protein
MFLYRLLSPKQALKKGLVPTPFNLRNVIKLV